MSAVILGTLCLFMFWRLYLCTLSFWGLYVYSCFGDFISFVCAVLLGTLCLFMFWGLYFICVCCPSGDFMFIQVLGILCQLFLCIVILRTECLLQSLWGVCTRCLRIRSCIVLGLVDNYYFCKLSFIVLFHVNFVSINIFKVECFIGLLVYLKLFLP